MITVLFAHHMPERTIVGLPFYEGEGNICLREALRNVDHCLSELNVDAPIIVLVNGPRTINGTLPPLFINRSTYNADVRIVGGDGLGQAEAINQIVHEAEKAGVKRVFITDADIYRFPRALERLWSLADRPLVGAHHLVYPREVVEGQMGRPLSSQEAFLYTLFERDKPPEVGKVISKFTGARPAKIKGSLMLVDTSVALEMHGGQNLTSDSVINRLVGEDRAQIAEGAFFMHMGRISMTDHICARLRHFRASAARGDLSGFMSVQESISPEIAEKIAAELIATIVQVD